MTGGYGLVDEFLLYQRLALSTFTSACSLNKHTCTSLTNTYRTTFYIEVTADLRTRMWQHLHGEGSAFVKRYHLHELVFVEYFERIADATDREKQLKRWHREWKLNLIRSVNPTMKCLKEDLDLL